MNIDIPSKKEDRKRPSIKDSRWRFSTTKDGRRRLLTKDGRRVARTRTKSSLKQQDPDVLSQPGPGGHDHNSSSNDVVEDNWPTEYTERQ